jgi:hypothetical protein
MKRHSTQFSRMGDLLPGVCTPLVYGIQSQIGVTMCVHFVTTANSPVDIYIYSIRNKLM